MQNNFITDAINLKSYNLSESDKIIVMYSEEKGLIRGVAKGVKKPKSKLRDKPVPFICLICVYLRDTAMWEKEVERGHLTELMKCTAFLFLPC